MGTIPATLPCGHPPYKEDDRYILDQCFECDWMTQSRHESHRLNEIAGERGNAEATLVKYVREGKYTSDETISGLRSFELKEMMDTIHELHELEEAQRLRCKIVQEEEDARGSD